MCVYHTSRNDDGVRDVKPTRRHRAVWTVLHRINNFLFFFQVFILSVERTHLMYLYAYNNTYTPSSCIVYFIYRARYKRCFNMWRMTLRRLLLDDALSYVPPGSRFESPIHHVIKTKRRIKMYTLYWCVCVGTRLTDRRRHFFFITMTYARVYVFGCVRACVCVSVYL